MQTIAGVDHQPTPAQGDGPQTAKPEGNGVTEQRADDRALVRLEQREERWAFASERVVDELPVPLSGQTLRVTLAKVTPKQRENSWPLRRLVVDDPRPSPRSGAR